MHLTWNHLIFAAVLAGQALQADANATVYMFDLEGHSVAPYSDPLFAPTPNPKWPWSYQYLITDFKRGDLVLSYDDANTAGFSDDLVKISGTVSTCHSNGMAPDTCLTPYRYKGMPQWQLDWDGVTKYFWDLTLSNPIDNVELDYTTTGFDNFAFDMQPVGTGRQIAPDPALITTGGGFNPTTNLSVKRGAPGWAFRLYDDGLGEDSYRIAMWLMINGGNGNRSTARLESFPWDALVNGDVRAYLRNPGSEIPEPTTLALLFPALAGVAKKRRRS